MEREERRRRINDLTGRIIGAAIEVHRHLGPGLLESVYEECLCYELRLAGIPYHRQLPLPIAYKEVKLDIGFRLDLLVEDLVIVELKSVGAIIPVFQVKLLTQLKLMRLPLGLLLNFNVPVMKDGIKRVLTELW